VKRGILHPDKVTSQNGTLEYRFMTEELDAIKDQTDQTRQTRQTGQDQTQESEFSGTERTDKTRHQTDQTRQTGHGWQGERAFLYAQIEQKDKQIEHLSRQVSVYSIQNSQLQNRLLELPAPEAKAARIIDTRRIVLLSCLAATILLFVYAYRSQIIALLTNY
jgi:hypothetical protein